VNGKIFKITNNDELWAIHEEKHHNENNFQELLFTYPDLIPGDQIDNENPRRWLRVGREIDNIDIFLLDQDGIPTIVEVKKIDNNEIHRLVTAQILDYGSKLFSQNVNKVRGDIDKYRPTDLNSFLGNDIDEEEFFEKVKKNLKEENMRLIVVSDEIPRNLQNIVEFLNNKMESIEVMAVEIKQYKEEMTGTKIFVPRLIGHSRDTMVFEPELRKDTLYENLDDVGTQFYRELLQFADDNHFKTKWTKTGFFLTVPLNKDEVKILHCYSKKYNFGQNIFSTNVNITDEVVDGNNIFAKCLKDILKLKDFEKEGKGFKFKIDKNLNEEQWKEFKRILLETKEQIEKNGLKTKLL
jgi:hypothetical protein